MNYAQKPPIGETIFFGSSQTVMKMKKFLKISFLDSIIKIEIMVSVINLNKSQ